MTAGEERQPASLRKAGVWLPAFEGIRGFCTIAVAFVHVFLAIGWAPRHELLGGLRYSAFYLIEFLFVIGGFVAMLPVLVSGRFEGWRSYALRRAGRMLPLYYFTIVLAVLLGGLLRPVTTANSPHDFWAVLAHAGFLQAEIYPFQAGFGVQGIVWVLSFAALFYALFPFIAERWARHPFLSLAPAIAIAVAWRLALEDKPDWFLQFPLFLVDFALGMTAAWVYIKRMRPGRALSPAEALPWFVLAVVAMLPLLYLAGRPIWAHEQQPWGEPWLLAVAVPSLFCVILLLAPSLPRWARAVFDNRFSRFLGEISYGVFLFHFLAIWLVLRFTDIPRNGSPKAVLELAVLAIPLTIASAWLGTRYIEGPLRKRAQRRASKLDQPARRPAPEAAPAGLGAEAARAG